MNDPPRDWRLLVVPMVSGIVLQLRVVQSAAILLARLLGDVRSRR